MRVRPPGDAEAARPGPNPIRGFVESPKTGDAVAFRNGTEPMLILRGEAGAGRAVAGRMRPPLAERALGAA